MREGHLFSSYTVEVPCEKTIVVEKNTKKSVLEAVGELEIWLDKTGLDNFLISIDASKVTDIEILAPLISYAIFLYRNISSSRVRIIKVNMCKNLTNLSFNEEDTDILKAQMKLGGQADCYINKGLNLVSLNNALNHKIDTTLEKLNTINEIYWKYSKDTKDSQKLSFENFKQGSNYNARPISLDTIYRYCFNEVDKLLSVGNTYYNIKIAFSDTTWDITKKQRLIISLLKGLPIGAFYINIKDDESLREGYRGVVWDGRERLLAIDSFLRNEFSIQYEGKELYYRDITTLFNTKLRRTIVSVYETNFTTQKEIIEAHTHINYNE